MSIDIRVLGVPELSAAFNRMDEALQKKIMRKALKQGAAVVLPRAKQLVRRKSGKLAASLKVKFSTRKGRMSAKIETGTREELGIKPDDKGYYPMSLETGHGNVPAYPYLRPALAEKEAEVLAQVKTTVAQGVEAEGKK